jgi:hypothetical protein
LICSREERPTNRIRGERPIVEIHALDEEIRQTSTPSKETELSPEAPSDEIEVQTADGLALDDRATTNGVVADAEPSQHDFHSEPGEQSGNAAIRLAHIRHNTHTSLSVASDPRTTRKKTGDLRPLPALSRSESA